MLNRVTVVSRLTRRPELRFTKNEKAVTNFGIAVQRQYDREKADFFDVTVWGKQAENCANYLVKGQMVAIDGRLQSSNFEDKEGNKRNKVEIVAENVVFLDKPKGKIEGEEVKDEEVPW